MTVLTDNVKPTTASCILQFNIMISFCRQSITINTVTTIDWFRKGPVEFFPIPINKTNTCTFYKNKTLEKYNTF